MSRLIKSGMVFFALLIFVIPAAILSSPKNALWFQQHLGIVQDSIIVGGARFKVEKTWVLLTSFENGQSFKLYGMFPWIRPEHLPVQYYEYLDIGQIIPKRFVIRSLEHEIGEGAPSFSSSVEFLSVPTGCRKRFGGVKHRWVELVCVNKEHGLIFIPELLVEVVGVGGNLELPDFEYDKARVGMVDR